MNKSPEYNQDYPALRLHMDPDIGELKVATLQGWLKRVNINPSTLAVCEVGFGGGHCLKFLSLNSTHTLGIEVSPSALDHAIGMGIPARNVLNGLELPDTLTPKIDLWIFQDSLEHLLNPKDFIQWAIRNSNPGVKFLVIAPEAESLSERLLRSLWPHRIPDHLFHWSKRGFKNFSQCNGLEVIREFTPKKQVSLRMIFRHLGVKFKPLTRFTTWLSQKIHFDPTFHFNIGEMGLVLKLRSPL